MPAGAMAVFLSATATPPFTATHRSSLLHLPFARLCDTGINRQTAPFLGYRVRAPTVIQARGAVIVKAFADIGGAGSSDPESPSESEDENMAIGDLALESKLQLKLEQKMKMKLGKNIRLRRKKLSRKRHLSKKGRWPPSKIKKNKNV